MALYPWRFQADVKKGETDPVVTLFIGPEREQFDVNGDLMGDKFVEQNTADPMQVKLSELPALLAGGAIVRKPAS